MTTSKTVTLGLLGWPVSHSRSPQMHTAALNHAGLDAVYVTFPVPPERLAEAVKGLRALGIRGANVTLPHKTEVAAWLDEVDTNARLIGAVNTIVCDEERLFGTNTDAAGLMRSLAREDVAVSSKVATVLGAGGAARAAVVGLLEKDVGAVTVVSRRVEQSQELVSSLQHHRPDVELRALSFDDVAALRDVFRRTELLLQATSATLGQTQQARDFAAALPMDVMRAESAVVDLVYAPLETTVLARAREMRLKTMDGLGMLVEQAALSFEAWMGCAPSIEVMRCAALT